MGCVWGGGCGLSPVAKHPGVFAALKKINEAHLVCADRGQDAGGGGKSQGRRAAGAAVLKMEESGKLGNTLNRCGVC